MNRIILIVLVVGGFLTACTEATVTETAPTVGVAPAVESIVPAVTVNKSLLEYDNKTSSYLLAGMLYSGYSVSYYPGGELKELFGILNGRKQNRSVQYFPDGHPKFMASYRKGKLDGEKKAWSPDPSHTLVSHLHYVAGKAHGEQREWYVTGEIYKKMNLNMGKEEGIQRAYRKNGDLYANYEAREGRIFGLKKAALCFGIEDETVRYAK